MARTLGRENGERGPTGSLGAYRARDGSTGAPVELDLDGPHVGVVVGKRGYGKSYTLGVVAEELAQAEGVAPVVADPMGVFSSLGNAGLRVLDAPRVPADALPPRAWCDLLGVNHESAVGALVWRAAAAAETVTGMTAYVADAEAARETRRAAENHIRLAESWDVFDPDATGALDAVDAVCESGAVFDLSGLDRAPMNAIVRAVAATLYDCRVSDTTEFLPWLLVDEAHAFFDGIAAPALRTLLTRGRQPGVSFVAATQRPSALPEAALSQADLQIAHRLTARPDREALARARPTYVHSALAERLPERPGEAVVIDDATESVHGVRIRERRTEHGGDSPRASRFEKNRREG